MWLWPPRARRCRRPLDLGAEPRSIQDAAPAWIVDGGIVLSGRILATVGLPMPLLAPEHALLIELTAVAADD